MAWRASRRLAGPSGGWINASSRRACALVDAAYVIGAFWAIAVVVFGVVERLVDRRRFTASGSGCGGQSKL